MQCNTFTVNHNSSAGGRLGTVTIEPHKWGGRPAPLNTPYFFPVVNVIGGPAGPERNGGLWRPVKWWMFLHERIPAYLCQVLHSLDFNIHGEPWDKWLEQPFGQWINEWQRNVPTQNYVRYTGDSRRYDQGYPFRNFMEHWPFWQQPPGHNTHPPVTFLDSGGFTLMNPKNLEKAKGWYNVRTDPKAILDLQARLGGDLIASLDFPVPPGMHPTVVWKRQTKSIEHALDLLRLLTDPEQEFNPSLPYLAIHGTSMRNGRWYVRQLARGWNELHDEARSRHFGLAIGSLVPRSDDPRTLVEITWGLMQGVKEWQHQLNHTPPVHTFGISSHMMGFLAYMGVDTFDSSTYAEVAQRGGYLDEHLRAHHVSDINERTIAKCDCTWCQGILEMGLLKDMQRLLVPGRQRAPGLEGIYNPLARNPDQRVTNSDLYGLLAMHNWHRTDTELRQIREAIRQDCLDEYLAGLVRDHRDSNRGAKLEDAMAWLAESEERSGARPRLKEAIRKVLNRSLCPVDRTTKNGKPKPRPESKNPWKIEPLAPRKHNFEDFNVPEEYAPPPGKKVLLLMACSKEKPYATSTHQRQIMGRLFAIFPDLQGRVHRVTLSGLYGPVPEELEGRQAVRDYDFMLSADDKAQQGIVRERLRAYLKKHREHYDAALAFIYFPGYHDVVDSIHKDFNIALVPERTRRGGQPKEHFQELVTTLANRFQIPPVLPKNTKADDIHPLTLPLSTFEFSIRPEGNRTVAMNTLLLLSPPLEADQILTEIQSAFPNHRVRDHIHPVSLLGPEGRRLPFFNERFMEELYEYLREHEGQYNSVVAFLHDDFVRDMVTVVFKKYRSDHTPKLSVVVHRPEAPHKSLRKLVEQFTPAFGTRPLRVAQVKLPFVSY